MKYKYDSKIMVTVLKIVKMLIRKIGQSPHRTLFNITYNYYKYKILENPYKIVYINPKDVRLSLNKEVRKNKTGLCKVMGGQWDQNVTDINKTKYKAIYEVYNHGKSWSETELFEKVYSKKLTKGKVRGCSNIVELENYYRNKMDRVKSDIMASGFKLPSFKNMDITYINVYIGRNGELINSGGGNHRLALASLLEINTIPVRVLCRHSEWQKKRISLWKNNITYDHPDTIY